jgi:hypothetical protein
VQKAVVDQDAGAKPMRRGELGLEKYCTACKEWWPADREFWYANANHSTRLAQWCKACYSERRQR